MASDHADSGADQQHRVRWHREREQRWAYGLGAAVLAVLLPVAAGFPDPRIRFGSFRGEMLVAVVAAVLGAAGLLAIAALIRRSARAGWFGIGMVVLMFGHPILDESFGDAPVAVDLARVTLVFSAVVVRGLTLEHPSAIARLVRGLALLLALAAVGLQSLAATGVPGAGAGSSLTLSLGTIAIGGVDFIRGQRNTEGDVAAFGMGALSFGFGGLLLLAGGGDQLTVGAACVSVVTAVCAVAAAMIAVLEALAFREARLETIRLSAALTATRLDAQTSHLAQLAHDQRSALFAIEAAARRLQSRPSIDLAAAVAAEASRLQRSLADDIPSARPYSVADALEPMLTCLESLGTPIVVSGDASLTAWGRPDDAVEVVRTLVDNARTHGKGPITIELLSFPAEAIVIVSDRGPGVPAALHESIFERGVTTAPRAHSGLGLWSARLLAERHGGSLRARSDRRSSFELRLPTHPPRHSEVDDRADVAILPVDELRVGDG
jgi:signal transduction histidine kinase